MDRAAPSGRRFDPRDCPLLQGLSPDEQLLRMQQDPRIRACIAAVEGTASGKPGQRASAYECCLQLAAAEATRR